MLSLSMMSNLTNALTLGRSCVCILVLTTCSHKYRIKMHEIRL